MVSLFFLTLGLVKMRDWGPFKPAECLLVSLLLFIIFIRVENRSKAPMIDLALFKVKSFTASVVVALLAQFFYIGVVVVIPSFLTRVAHKTELEAALLLLPMSLTVFAFGGLGSLAINKLGPRLLVFTGSFSLLTAYELIITNGEQSSLWLSLALLVLGVGFGIIAGPINVLAAANFRGSLLTSSQSVMSVVRQLGSILGVSIFLAMTSANLKSLSVISPVSLGRAYLSSYTVWIPVLIGMLLLIFIFPTKQQYLTEK